MLKDFTKPIFPYLLLSGLFFLSFIFSVMGQQGTISGTVTLNPATESLSGTSVVIKGQTAGSTTDERGSFSIAATVPATLVISRVGYITQEVTVQRNVSVQITLQASTGTSLNEVVVISYGRRTKREVTGAISTVGAAEVRNVPASEFGQKLQGRVPGVQINQTNGRPGQGIDFRIRGAASLSSGFQPLIVVDGQPLVGANSRNGDMNLINPDDIETFTVLKDASSTSLYGSRAANGVILITTKSAKAGKTQLSLDTYYGWQTVPQRGRFDLMNAREFATFMKEFYEDKAKYENYTAGVPSAYQNPEQYGEGTNWYNALLRTAPMQNYSLNITSGGEKVSSASNLSYFDQKGVLLNTGMQRFAFRSNNEFRVNNKFKIGLNLAPSYQIDKNTRGGTDGFRQILGNATGASPLFDIYNPDGSYISRVSSPGMLGFNNPVQQMNNLDAQQNTLRLLANLFGELEIVKDLRLRSSFNTDFGTAEYNQFQGSMYGIGLNAAVLPRPASSITSLHSSYNYLSWLNENTLTYNTKIGNHGIELLGGMSAQKWSRNFRNISGSNFAGDAIPWISGAATTSGSNNNEAWSLTSLFGRATYSYLSRYILTGSLRQDGSSRFGENKKTGLFPSVAAAWIVSDEGFFPENKVVNFFKLRGSYGQTGNFNIGNYAHISNITGTNYVFGGSLTPGLSVTTLGNTDLTWEVSDQLDLGLDLQFFNNRINFTYDYYKKYTTGMLFGVSLPYSSGFGSVTSNVGKFSIWGHEFQLNTINTTGALSWNTDFNISFNDNKVLELPPNTPFVGGGPRYNGWNRSVVGHRIGEFYGYVFDGIYMTDAELQSQPKEATSMVGTTRMKDIDGDGKITENDRTLIGNPNPKFIYGINNNMYYKNFDFNFLLSGHVGNKIMNANLQDLHNNDGVFNMTRDMIDRWRSPEQQGDGKTPRTRSGTTELYRLANSTWVQDGDFLALRNIALGYTLKKDVLKYLQSTRLYLSVQNAFLFTKYKGQNPEANSGRDDAIGSFGQDNSTFPVPRTFMIGANITF